MVFLGKGKTSPDDTKRATNLGANPPCDSRLAGVELFCDENPDNHQVRLEINSKQNLSRSQMEKKTTIQKTPSLGNENQPGNSDNATRSGQ